jgi:hypothetical protein
MVSLTVFAEWMTVIEKEYSHLHMGTQMVGQDGCKANMIEKYAHSKNIESMITKD